MRNSAMAINDRQIRYHDDLQAAVTYVYCSYQERAEQTAQRLLISLTWQLALSSSNAFQVLERVYGKHNKGGMSTQPTCQECVDIISHGAQSSGLTAIFIFVDALDELEPDERNLLLDALEHLTQDTDVFRILLMSRPATIPALSFNGTSACLDIHAADADVQAYVRRQISIRSDFDAIKRDSSMVDLIVNGISKTANGMQVEYSYEVAL